MNNKDNTIEINNIFKDLIFKNKIAIIFLFLITIITSYLYNNHFKTIVFKYLINIQVAQVWISEDSVIEIPTPKDLYRVLLNKYLQDLPPNAQKKFYNYDKKTGVLKLTLESFGENQIDMSNLLKYLNDESRSALLKRFNTLLRNNSENINRNIDLDKEVMMKLLVQQNNVDESDLKYYIQNFNELFNDNIYYSLNGWEITSNKFNKIEILISGILFGILISSFFLFFRSNYFKRALLN